MNPNTRKKNKPVQAGKPFTYLNWMATRAVVVIMTVATAKLIAEN